MVKSDKRKLCSDKQYELRKQVVELRNEGKSNREISDIVGYCYSHVSTIWQKYKKGTLDIDADQPKACGRKYGEKRKLTVSQESEIISLLVDMTPNQLKSDYYLWNRESIRLAIKQELGVDLPLRTLTDYLGRWGFVPRKPIYRADEYQKKVYQSWEKRKYKEIVSIMKKDKAEIHWFDIAALPGNITMISTVTNRRKVRFMLCRGELNKDVYIDFIQGLKKDCSRKIYFIAYKNKIIQSLSRTYMAVYGEKSESAARIATKPKKISESAARIATKPTKKIELIYLPKRFRGDPR